MELIYKLLTKYYDEEKTNIIMIILISIYLSFQLSKVLILLQLVLPQILDLSTLNLALMTI